MKLIPFLSALLFTTTSLCQTPNLHWKYQNDGTSTFEDRGQQIAYDNAGNVIVAGYVYQGCTNTDIVVLKYDPAGNLLWTRTYDGSGTYGEEDLPKAIAIDASNNIIVAGSTENGGFYYGLTMKLDPSGNFLWTNRYNPAYSTINDVAIDPSGNVLVCGYREISNNKDFLVIKYSPAGSQLWMQNFTNGNHDEALAIETDAGGNVYVTGRQSGVNAFYDWATLKYSSSGAQQWLDVFANANFAYSEMPVDIDLDNNGNVYVAGSAPLLSFTNTDMYVIKYNNSGSRIWETNIFNPTNNNAEYADDMVVDGAGNVFLTGTVVTNPGGQDISTLKLNDAGQLVWMVNTDSIQQTDYARNIVLDPTGNFVYSTGDVTVFASAALKRDIIIQKYDTSGNEVARVLVDGPANDFDLPWDLAINASGQLAITGMISMNTEGNGDVAALLFDGQLNSVWTKYHNGDGFADDTGSDMIVDHAGNAYVCGTTYSANLVYENLFVFKTDASGNRLWEYVYSGPEESSSEKAVAITVDALQNVYITGTVDTSTTGSYRDIFAAKISPAGNVLWERIFSGSQLGPDIPNSIVVGANGNIFIGASTLNATTGFDGTVLCYDPAGNLLWSSSYDDGSLGESFQDIAVDAQNNTYAAGAYQPVSGALSDGLLVKFDPSGSIVWDTTYDFSTSTSDRDFFNSIALDANGNAFVAGQANFNFVTAKYSPAGVPVWVQNYSHSTNPDSATVVKIDVNGDVLVGGIFGQFIEQDFGIVKYRNDGTLIWDRRYSNTAGSDDLLSDMTTDSIGNVYVTGWETNQFSTNYNFMTLKYDSAGTFKWELIWTDSLGIGPDYGKKIGLDGNGHIYVMGDANENCFGNVFVNGFRWNTQVLRYGQGIFSGTHDVAITHDDILAYPNPGSGSFTIRASSGIFGNGPITLKVYDVSGKLMFEKNTTAVNDIYSDELTGKSGIFIYTLTSSAATRSGRIVVQKN